ncbi:hypothetical protein CEE37_03550 [candidate division LCP-89 bacterium B3_LCP]|uniref:FlgD Ig-like domain-containing protein n=1 Tax=candidate division LCP-89 bacterium B3_LCP TaxID=2012998 RepID=A0A532V361_UNCL8|nr:MAG: hypothetical protein CEE37_03550 [candidate division LCP-89 bacterium B3_LCP]
MKKTHLGIIFLLLLNVWLYRPCVASDWEILPSVHSVRSLIRIDHTLWGATNSGLFQFDLSTHTFKFYTTVDGLSSNDISAMVLDDRGNLILGMTNAYIDIFNLTTHQVSRISDFKLSSDVFHIYAMYNHDGEIYVGTDVGVHRVVYFEDLNKYLIQNSYENLGSFTPQEAKVQAILVYQDGLWVGTPEGAARGDLTAGYLESPQNWTNYTTVQGLSSDEISSLEVFHDTLYAATPQTGLNVFDGSAFQALNVQYTTDITFLKAHQDTLYIGRTYGIQFLNGSIAQGFGPQNARGGDLEFDSNGNMWGGFETIKTSAGNSKFGGLQEWDGQSWTHHLPEGPLVETVRDILVEDDGSVWVCGKLKLNYNNGTLCHFDGSHWTNIGHHNDDYIGGTAVSSDSFFYFQPTSMTRDHTGSVWVGSHGRGAGWFEFTGDTISAKGFFSETTGELTGIGGTPYQYCVVEDILTDYFGNVWICNSQASSAIGGPIAVVPSDFITNPQQFPNWNYTTVMNESGSAPIPNAEFYIDRIIEDSYRHKWFGADNGIGSGIHILDDNTSPLFPADDTWLTFSELATENITALACDREGVVWVGTADGVRYYYPESNPDFLYGIDVYNFPIGPNINVIAIDPQDNKWFGTNDGVAVLGSDNYTWLEAYTSIEGDYPSPLPSDVVLSIDFDIHTGDAYIGTGAGLAVLKTPYQQMEQTVTYLAIAKPNPFVIADGSDNRLFLDPMGLSETSELKVFTLSGLLVRQLIGTEITAGWDGRNARNEMVGSGVYLLLAYAPDGSSAVGKVAVIHQ